MLDRRDISLFVKPLSIAMLCKTIIFLALVVFLIAKNLTGFSTLNPYTAHCDNYFNAKISLLYHQTLIAQFLMSLFGLIASGLSLTIYAALIILFRKQQKQKLSQKKRLSQNRIKVHIILAFIESICAINILSRAIQKINQQAACNIQNKTNFIVILILIILVIVLLGFTLLVLFKFLSLIQEKQKALEEYTFYSDQITLQQNLLFNKTGYIKQLVKLEDYSSRSGSMKDELVKNFPSGYKKTDDLSPKRQIVYRLRGGNTTSNVSGINNLADHKSPEEDGFGDFENNNSLSKSRLQQSGSQHQGKPLQLNLMAINNDRTLDETPNDENYQYVELTNNVIDLSFNKGLLQDLNEESEYESSSEEESESYANQRFAMEKGGSVTPKKQKDIAQQLKLEEELRQKFNLTSNNQSRRRYAHRRNEQNIDDYGNYFYVDVDKIQKRSKLLNFQKMNDEASNVDPNALYAKGDYIPRQKRLSKKHEKYVAEYLKKLNILKKQEMLYQEESSFQSDEEDFEEQSEQSSDQSEQESSSEVDPVPVTVLDPVTGQPVTIVPEKQRRKKNQGPELYLYIKKRKLTGRQHKLKLFEDDEGFDDSEESKQNQQEEGDGLNGPQKVLLQTNVNGQKITISVTSTISKEHLLQKLKHEEKVILVNKHLQTDEARMLRFIRRKYISKELENGIIQMGNIYPPNIDGVQGYQQLYDPSQYQNMNSNQGINQAFNPNQGMSPSLNMGQYQNPNPNINPNQYPNQPFEGNIFAPPPQNYQVTPNQQTPTSNHYQMSPNQTYPGFQTPFNLQTPPPSNQLSSNPQIPPQYNQMPPQNYQIPPPYNQMAPSNNYMAPNMQTPITTPKPTTK